MIAPPLHKNEKLRLLEVESYSFFKSKKEKSFSALTAFVAEYFNVDACGISVVSEYSVYSKFNTGLDLTEFPRDFSLCAHTILEENGPLEINDLRADERFHDNPMLTGPSSMRFYAAYSLISKENMPIGTFCILNKKPRVLSEGELKMLYFFSVKCMEMFELRKANLTNPDHQSSLLTDTENELIKSLLSNKLRHPNQSPEDHLEEFTCALQEDPNYKNALTGDSAGFNKFKSELKITKQYLDLEDIGVKEKLSLEKLLEDCLVDLPRIKTVVHLEKEAEILGAPDHLEFVMTSILKFIACKNGFRKMNLSSITSENQSIIIISSENAGFDKDEQRNLFTLNLEHKAHYSPCKGMEIPYSKKIIGLHGGTVQIYSAQNAGLSFFISLPNS